MSRTELVFSILAELAKLILAFAITAINAYVLYTVLRTAVPEASKDLIIAAVNGAGIAQGAVLQYYFGSSAGSAAKDRKATPT